MVPNASHLSNPHTSFLSLLSSLPGHLKSLLQLQPPCPDLCCHIIKQHPQHCLTFTKYLKKHGTLLPAQAPLLSLLLNQDEVTLSAHLSKAALLKVLESIKEWVLDTGGAQDATRVLIPHVLRLDLLGESVCLSASLFILNLGLSECLFM